EKAWKKNLSRIWRDKEGRLRLWTIPPLAIIAFFFGVLKVYLKGLNYVSKNLEKILKQKWT
ncbi:MAG: hypothetical protein ACPLZH_03595, partial [Minisyncoccales bacterium]